MAIPIVGKKFSFVLHSDIILQNDDYEETYNPKRGVGGSGEESLLEDVKHSFYHIYFF